MSDHLPTISQPAAPVFSFAGPPAEGSYPTPAGSAAETLRIRHVDSLRAIAAGLVVWTHFSHSVALVAGPDPAFLGFLQTVPRTLDIGRLGVMIFFAVSGFVICRSFGGPREGGSRRFVIRRFCRLYPAFWVSMVGGALIWRLPGQALTWRVVAANVTMAPAWFGQPCLLGVYWTLEVELLFYGLCLGLYWAGSLHRRALLAGGVAGLAALPRLLKIIDHTAGTHLALPPGKPTLFLSLAVMFWGMIFRLVYDETGGFRRNTWSRPGVWLLFALTLVLIDVPDPNVKWFLLGHPTGKMPGHLSVVYALGIFWVWVAYLRIDHRTMMRVGMSSYSLYLFHLVVQAWLVSLAGSSRFVAGLQLPFWTYLLVGAGWSVGLAMIVYRWVERPAIALGKRWAGSPRREVVVD